MKPSKLYSNKSDIFVPIEFTPELNVVLAEIRLPENRNRDTHNLGKTTLGRLLDFGFLAGRDELASLPEGSIIAEMLTDYAVMREQARACSPETS